MAKQERLYKDKVVNEADPDQTFIKIDSARFKRPMAISASDLSKILLSSINTDTASNSVSAVVFSGQDEDPSKPPEDIKISDVVNIAIDENYLYIWVPSANKWKRIMLGDWPEPDLPDPD